MSQIQKNSAGDRRDAQRATSTSDTAVVPIRGTGLLESTLPPTPLRDLLAAEGAAIYVLTQDPTLLATVEEAGGEQFPVFAAESWSDLREAIVNRRCGIALLDLDALDGALTDRLAKLASLSASLVMLVASQRDRADELLSLLSQRKIHRLLIKPPTVGITRLLLESSVNRHMALRQRPDLQPQRVGTGAARARMRLGWVAVGIAVVVVIVGALAAYLSRSDTAAVTVRVPAAGPAQRLVDAPQGSVSSTRALRDGARADSVPGSVAASGPQADIVSIPSGPAASSTSALDSSGVEPAETVTAGPDPAEIEARYGAIEAALLADELDTADQLIAELAPLEPESSRVAFLRGALERARLAAAEAVAAAEAAAAAEQAAAAPSELTSLVGLARARLDQGQIEEPSGDSALDYLGRARTIDPASLDVADLSAEIAAAVINAAEADLVAGRLAAAEAHFAQARDLGANDEDLAALNIGLAEARDAQAQAEFDSLLARVSDHIEAGMLFEPATDSALSALLELRQRDPGHAGLAAAGAALERALEADAAAALAASDWQRAAAAVEALERAGAPMSTVGPLQADLVFRRQQAAFLADPVPAGQLVITAFDPPVYPSRAFNRGTEGWVDLEFIVDNEGRPRDVVVVGAEPEGEFEDAALAAARTYEFVPFELDGRVYERRVSLRMRFALQ